MKARYNRISTPNQKLERQLAKQHPNEKQYIEVASGSIPFRKRDEGSLLIRDIERGDINYLSVSSIDRMGRSVFNILETINFLNTKNVTLKVDNLGIESIVNEKLNPTFNLIISVMASVAQMERETLLERQKEGIELAKAKGVYKGRVRGSKESDEDVIAKYTKVVKYLKNGQSLRNTKSLAGVSLGTVQKVKSILLKKEILSI